MCLHHVFDDEEAPFRALLTTLSKSHHFIGYSEAVERIQRGAIDRPYLCLSFDDGLKNGRRAAQIMSETGAKACFFVCPPMAEAPYQEVARFCAERLAMPPTEMLSWNDMEQIVALGHEIGSHTLSHPDLSGIGADQIAEEVGRSREQIIRRLGRADHFAWPFGRFRDMSSRAASEVFRAGYASCASAERGCHTSPVPKERESLCLRREHCVAFRPQSHSLYFLARSAQRASGADDTWPADWSVDTR